MTQTRPAAVTLVLATLATTQALAANPTPQVGYYAQDYFVLSASVNGAGSCIDKAGAYFTQGFYFPGPSKKGAKAWRVFNANGVLENEVITLPETPAPGATTWSGTFSAVFLPGGTPFNSTFNTSFTITDASSSVGTTTVVGPTPQGGTCTETTQFNQIYTGK